MPRSHAGRGPGRGGSSSVSFGLLRAHVELDAFLDEPAVPYSNSPVSRCQMACPPVGSHWPPKFDQPSIGVVQRARVNPPGRAAQRSVVLKSTMRPCSSTKTREVALIPPSDILTSNE